MIEKTVKIVLPIAGLGTRLRPHTLYRPKPLISLAGKAILDFVLDKFSSIPKSVQVEYIFIIGNMGEQIKEYMDEYYPDVKVSYFVQKEMRGQSDALYIARELISGPIIISFGDTVNNPDFSASLFESEEDGVVWVKNVADINQLGVIQVDDKGYITHLFEKPKEYISNLALVGVYYFQKGEDLIKGIEKQFEQGDQLKGEFYLANAINNMIASGAKIKSETVDIWMDTGTIDNLLETNAYLLSHGRDNSSEVSNKWPGTTIIPPVWVEPSVEVYNSVIGPNVVVECGCRLEGATVRESIIQRETSIKNAVVENSVVGRNETIVGQGLSAATDSD